MLSCTTRFCTCLITFCALLWLFSSVNADVPLQGSCSIDRAPAFFTVMWLLSTVGEKMLGKIFFCDWWKFATIALIWLLCGVCFDVISKITCLCSCIIAVSTCVAFPNCGLASAFSDLQLGQRNLHILRICDFWHWTQALLWVIMCPFKCTTWPNDFLHSEQVWVFSPLWVSMYVFKVPAGPNDYGRAYADSSVQQNQMISCTEHN